MTTIQLTVTVTIPEGITAEPERIAIEVGKVIEINTEYEAEVEVVRN